MEHSFRTAPYDSSIMKMAEELQSLGGFGASTARLNNAISVAAIFGPHQKKRRSTKGDSIITSSSNGRNSSFVTVAQSGAGETTCKVTATASSPSQLNDHLVNVTAWLLDDFNGTVLSFGCNCDVRGNSSAGKLAFETLKHLFGKKNVGLNRNKEYQLYLSAWEVGTDSRELVTDLMSSILDPNEAKGTTGRSFKAMHIPTLNHASTILSSIPSKVTTSPHKANVFVRIILRSEITNTTSAVHFVDMVSTAEVSERNLFKGRSKKNPSSLGRQSHAFAKVITHLAETATTSTSNKSDSERSRSILLASARESKLTQMLTPLLGGNNRTWFVGYLCKDASKVKETNTTLKLLGKGGKVMCGCVKNANNGADDINFLPAPVVEREARVSNDDEAAGLSDDSIDGGDKWLNEFKMRREAIVNSPPPKKMERKEEKVEKAAVDVPAAKEEGDDRRRRSYALTGGKRLSPVRQSTLLVGSKSFYGGVTGEGGDGGGEDGDVGSEKEGWLWKKGSKRHNWNQRWFAIEGQTLAYYKGQNKKKMLGSLDLRGCKVDAVKNEKYADKFAFDITIPGPNGVEVRHLHCDNEIERIRWLLNLEEALGSLAFVSEKAGAGSKEGEGYVLIEWSEGEEEEDGEEEDGEEVGGEEERGGNPNKLFEDTSLTNETTGKINRSSLSDVLESLKFEGEEIGAPTLENLASSEDFAASTMIGSKGGNELGGGADDDAGSMLSSLLSGGDDGEDSSKGGDVGVRGVQEKGEEGAGNSTTLTATFNTSTSSHTIPSLSMSAGQIEPNLLQSNYDTLLSMLREERRIRGKMNDKIANLEHTLMETSTSYQLDIDDLKKENMDVKRKFRKLSKESAYKEVFEQFEGEIRSLRSEAASLKDANVRLEMKLAEAGGFGERRKKRGKGGASAGMSGGPPQPPMQYQDGLMKQLTRRNRELEAEVKRLRVESGELKQKGRLLDVSKTQIQHSQSNMLKLGDELKQQKQQSYTLNMSNSRLEAALLHAEKEAAQWRQLHAESEAREEMMKGELHQATANVLKYKHMSKKNNLIQHFLDKHAPKPEVERDSGGNGDTVHDVVQELAAQIRRVQPNLMGAVAAVANKIEEEGRNGRKRERELMKSMVELLDENVENISSANQGFKERKVAIARKVMENSAKR